LAATESPPSVEIARKLADTYSAGTFLFFSFPGLLFFHCHPIRWQPTTNESHLGGIMTTDDDTVTVEDVVRLGTEAATALGRPINQAELEALCDFLHGLRVSAAMLALWDHGDVMFELGADDILIALTGDER